MHYLDFFQVQMGPGSQIKRSQLRLAALFNSALLRASFLSQNFSHSSFQFCNILALRLLLLFLVSFLILDLFLKVKIYLRCKTFFLAIKEPLIVTATLYFFCFIFKMSRVWRFCKFHKFQNLRRHHKHSYIMEVTLMLISFESYVLSKWNLVKYLQAPL